jgi:hypothetical protein
MVAFVGSILKGENGFMRLELCLEKYIHTPLTVSWNIDTQSLLETP